MLWRRASPPRYLWRLSRLAAVFLFVVRPGAARAASHSHDSKRTIRAVRRRDPPHPTAAAHHYVSRSRRRRRRHSWHMPRGYAKMVVRWHQRKPHTHAPLDGRGRPELVLESVNTHERIVLSAATDHGGFSASELDRAAHLLRDTHDGAEFPTDPRLLDLVYQLERHFRAPAVRVISGYRTPGPHSHSRHGQGRAIDLVVPGASNRSVARYVRQRGFCGVGVYPRSGFVHVDVRPASYFWVDHTGPGQPNRAHPVFHRLANRVDAAALAKGTSRPRASVRPDPNVEAAWDDELAARASNAGQNDSESGANADDQNEDRAAASAEARRNGARR